MLRDRLMLAKCSISLWGNMRKDRGVEREVAQAKHVKKGKAGRWDTNLLTGADTEYEAVQSSFGAVRDFHYENTLKWGHGEQVLPNERFIAYAKGMGQLKGLAEQRLEDLLEVWDDRVKESQENSPELTRKFTYPSREDLKTRCGITIQIGPLPESSDLVLKASDEEAQKLLTQARDDMELLAVERVKEAKKDLFMRLHKHLTNAQRNLGIQEGVRGRFRDEWYENLAAFCEMAPQMNFDKDQKLEDLVEEVKVEIIEKHSKDDFSKKENKAEWDDARAEAEEKVNDILSKMAGIF